MTGSETQPSAFIKHQLPGRVRLKIPQKKGDFRYFDRIAESFAECLGITQLQLNPPAASILICHRTDTPFQDIVEFAETKSLFSLTEMPKDYEAITIPNLPLATLTSTGLSRIDKSLLSFSHGRLDGRSLLFLALIGLAIHQITRGNIMAPAASLLWYALDVLKQETETRFEIENKTESQGE
jgi:hypothetical protein